MRLHLRQVEVRAAAARELLGGVVEEVQAEVDQAADERRPSRVRCCLVEVPAARPRQDHRQVVGVLQRVGLALGRGEGDGAAHGVVQVHLALDDVAPVRGVGVLEVGQPDPRTGVEGVDRHLAARRPGDLDAAVAQVAAAPGRPASRCCGSRRSTPRTADARRPRSAPDAYAGPRAARRVAGRRGSGGRRRRPAPPASAPPPSGRRAGPDTSMLVIGADYDQARRTCAGRCHRLPADPISLVTPGARA